MISDKKVLDFTKKMILVGDIAIFIIILAFIYISFFTGQSNSVQVYNLDDDSKRVVNIVQLNSSDLEEGVEVVLDSSVGAWVKSSGKYYTFELFEIFPESQKASLYIENLPLNVIFEKDQQRSFDLNSDGYYDISVYLKQVSSREAVFLFKQTNEEVKAGDSFSFWVDYLKGTASKDIERQNYLLLIFYVMVVIMLVFVLTSFVPVLRDYLKYKKIKKRKSYSEVMQYLIRQFSENKKYDQEKSSRIYERMKFVYKNLNPRDKKRYKSSFEKIENEVLEWKNI